MQCRHLRRHHKGACTVLYRTALHRVEDIQMYVCIQVQGRIGQCSLVEAVASLSLSRTEEETHG